MFGFVGFFLGILSAAFGLFMILFFPSIQEHQDENFTISGIVIGIVCLVIGFVLMFY